jgi:hypothetical protein
MRNKRTTKYAQAPCFRQRLLANNRPRFETHITRPRLSQTPQVREHGDGDCNENDDDDDDDVKMHTFDERNQLPCTQFKDENQTGTGPQQSSDARRCFGLARAIAHS